MDVQATAKAGPVWRASGQRAGLSRTATWSPIFVPVGLFLLVFGTLNFAGLPFGWTGTTPRSGGGGGGVGDDLGLLGLGRQFVLPVLWAQKCLEAVLGLSAAGALIRRDVRFLAAAIAGWMVVMTYFSAFDIRAADHRGLLEHTSYFGVFTLLLAAVVLVTTARALQEWAERMESAVRANGSPDARAPSHLGDSEAESRP